MVAIGLPAGLKAEVEFTAGTWTDITTDVEFAGGLQIHFGRTSQFGTVQPATLTGLQIDNTSGKYTPLRQVLADGVTANTLYPNVVPRKRIRVSYLDSGAVRRYVYTGHVTGWPPALEGQVRPIMVIDAVDRLDQLARISCRAAAVQSLLSKAPAILLPLDEPAGSATFADIVSNYTAFPVLPAGASVTAGVDNPVPYPDGLTGVSLAQGAQWAVYRGTLTGGGLAGATTSGVTLPSAASTHWTVAGWVTLPVAAGGNSSQAGLVLETPTASAVAGISLDNSGGAGTIAVTGFYQDATAGTLNIATTIPDDGKPHFYAVTGSDGGTLTVRLRYDDSSAGFANGTGGGGLFGSQPVFFAGQEAGTGATIQPALFGPAAVFAATLDATDIDEYFHATQDDAGFTDTRGRIQEYLRWGGVADADTDMDSSTLLQHLTFAIPTAGKSLLDCINDQVTTEGGGAVFYSDTQGKCFYRGREFRTPGSPVLTIDATQDLDGSSFTPAYDATTLLNSSTVTGPSGATLTDTDPVSVAAYGLSSESGLTSYAVTDGDALNLAQYRVASQAYPGLRLDQITLDLATAEHDFYASLASVRIGSRIRLTNLPPTLPRSTVDLYVEGWTLTLSPGSFRVVFDTSPADNPARFVWDDTSYGRWRPNPGGMTLTSGITRTATSLSVTTSAGPTFTTTSGSYPLSIKIGEEVLTITTAPGSSASPQTLTVTRAQANSLAAAQSSGAVVDLYQAGTWTL